ncbi:MAG: hypothetical protein M3R02_02970 [Chloroflexota bacterium]|nr:hypothetical protein [Chloroflexota bacterium]
MGNHPRGNEPPADDRDGTLDRDVERSMGVLEVALLVGVLAVFLLVVVFFAVTRGATSATTSSQRLTPQGGQLRERSCPGRVTDGGARVSAPSVSTRVTGGIRAATDGA